MVASGSTTSFAGVLQQFKAELTNNWPLCAGLAAGLYCMYKLVTFLRYVACETAVSFCKSNRALLLLPPALLNVCRADADLELLSKRKPPKNAFADKVVWITGASQVRCHICCDEVPSRLHLGFQLWFLDLQGLGEELAKQFAAQGAYLILSSRNAARLEVLLNASSHATSTLVAQAHEPCRLFAKEDCF